MTRTKLPGFSLIAFAALWLLLLSSGGDAMEREPGSSDLQTASEAASDLDPAAARGVPSSRLEGQEEYRQKLQAYEEAMAEAQSDEERVELSRRFQEETRDYREFLAEKDMARQSQARIEEIRALQKGFDAERRLMKQDHDRSLRAIDKERNEYLSGVHENWPARVRTLELKKQQINNDYQKRLRLLEERYSRQLKELD